MSIEAVKWQDGKLLILDQRLIPAREEWLEATDYRDVAEAIRDMAVRGAPLIGVAAAYGMALAQRAGDNLQEAKREFAATRPTAVNLFWALDRVAKATDLLAEADKILDEEKANSEAIGKNGAALVPQNAGILTICNTGSLATPGIGTAHGIIRTAFAQGKVREVFSCETRPRQQGLRLTAWELTKDGIPFKSIADGAAGWLMARGCVQIVIAGADRIAANGDTANKIGTYSLAVLAKEHHIPLAIAAPSSSIDANTPSGDSIPIEERPAAELTDANYPVWNPAFDVTPARLISNIVTERSAYSPPYDFAGVFFKSH